jgi:hypothetical protein
VVLDTTDNNATRNLRRSEYMIPGSAF